MSLFSVGDLHRCWSNTNQMHLHFPSKFFYQHNQQFLPICAWNSSFRVVLATPNTSINPSSCTAFTLRSRMITLWFISKSTRSFLMSQLELRQSSPEQSNFCSFSVCFTFFGHEIEKENVDISIDVCTKCSYYFHISNFICGNYQISNTSSEIHLHHWFAIRIHPVQFFLCSGDGVFIEAARQIAAFCFWLSRSLHCFLLLFSRHC